MSITIGIMYKGGGHKRYHGVTEVRIDDKYLFFTDRDEEDHVIPISLIKRCVKTEAEVLIK